MTRELTDNDELKVTALDEPGHGGAAHRYLISAPAMKIVIRFQDGPIKEAGINGITDEVLLRLIIHRLKAFQAGKYACPENGEALFYTEKALDALKARTEERESRGVEGTHKV